MADRAGDWLSQAVDKALKGLHLSLGQQVWGHGLGRRSAPCRMEPRPTITAAQKPDGFGHLQSREALSHARTLVDAIAAAMA